MVDFLGADGDGGALGDGGGESSENERCEDGSGELHFVKFDGLKDKVSKANEKLGARPVSSIGIIDRVIALGFQIEECKEGREKYSFILISWKLLAPWGSEMEKAPDAIDLWGKERWKGA